MVSLLASLDMTIPFVVERLPQLWLRIGEHLLLTGISTGLAIFIGIPLGILVARVVSLRSPLLGLISIVQTIPSLAMLAILLALLGKIGTWPAVIALTLYALLPIVRNTLVGIEGVAPQVIEAARGIGMTAHQELWLVKMPLALPVIAAGIRTAAVVCVGIATLSAFIGAGGLGQFINRGLALSNTSLILLGAIPAALLALIVDFSIAAAEWGLRPTRQAQRNFWRMVGKPLAIALPFFLIVTGIWAYRSGQTLASPGLRADGKAKGIVRIGSKNFTEQLVLGEILAQWLESQTELTVERHFNLGGTMICHGAMVHGEIDLYPEYTGTGLTAILQQNPLRDPVEVLKLVSKEYQRQFDMQWLSPFGFNNTYALTVRQSDARDKGWKTISELAASASTLRAGFTSEFAERPDGYPGLRQVYGFSFGQARDLEPALMYEAVAKGEVDVICAFATDGRIAAYQLTPLSDDRGFFPPYMAAPVVRGETLRKYPELRDALASLAGLLNEATMQRLNYEVDQHQHSPVDVARDFLRAQKRER